MSHGSLLLATGAADPQENPRSEAGVRTDVKPAPHILLTPR